VWLIIIVQHPCGFAEASEGGVHFYTLIPRNSSILVVVQNQDGGIYLVKTEKR
jgi:hypothetical protein